MNFAYKTTRDEEANVYLTEELRVINWNSPNTSYTDTSSNEDNSDSEHTQNYNSYSSEESSESEEQHNPDTVSFKEEKEYIKYNDVSTCDEKTQTPVVENSFTGALCTSDLIEGPTFTLKGEVPETYEKSVKQYLTLIAKARELFDDDLLLEPEKINLLPIPLVKLSLAQQVAYMICHVQNIFTLGGTVSFIDRYIFDTWGAQTSTTSRIKREITKLAKKGLVVNDPIFTEHIHPTPELFIQVEDYLVKKQVPKPPKKKIVREKKVKVPKEKKPRAPKKPKVEKPKRVVEEKYSNAGKRWSPEEDALLLVETGDGHYTNLSEDDIVKIALGHKRTPFAIKCRLALFVSKLVGAQTTVIQLKDLCTTYHVLVNEFIRLYTKNKKNIIHECIQQVMNTLI